MRTALSGGFHSPLLSRLTFDGAHFHNAGGPVGAIRSGAGAVGAKIKMIKDSTRVKPLVTHDL